MRSGHRVVALAYDGLCTFEFGIAVEIFALQRPELGVPWYHFRIASADRGPLRATGGFRIMVDGGINLLGRADTIIVPGWKGADVPVPPRLSRLIARAHNAGARVASICSGAFVLAAAGVLDNRRATTHWRYAEELQRRYPRIKVEPNVLYVDEGSVLTSAGSAAGLDMLVHLVRNDYGPAIANAVARRLVVPPHREGGQAQFIPRAVPTRRRDRYGALLDDLSAHLDRPHSLPGLASAMHMSVRTLSRGFKDATGLSVMQWLVAARLRRAQELLETSDRPVESIAEQCGFGSPETLRHHFREALGTSPVAFRKAFRRRALPRGGARNAAAGAVSRAAA